MVLLIFEKKIFLFLVHDIMFQDEIWPDKKLANGLTIFKNCRELDVGQKDEAKMAKRLIKVDSR